MKEEKKALRRELIAARRQMPETERIENDRAIAELFLSLPEYKKADILLLYASYGEEIDTKKIAEAAELDGKRLAFPLCGKEGTMTFHFCRPDELSAGYKGIPEPPATSPHYGGERALCIVPALAIDESGFRLGYGGGFYDRFLKDFDGVTVGFVRDGFYFEGLPREEFDLPIDITVKRSEVKYNEI